MVRINSIFAIFVALFCAALAGCGGSGQFGGQPGNNGNSAVVLAMTDSPPSNVTILSAVVTLTGVTLAPGNVALFSGSTTVDLTRLQTDVAYLTTAANIPAGTYTSVTLTFANPSLTIENDTNGAIGTCAIAAICKMPPTSTANLSTTVPLTSFSLAASSVTGLLIDVNLDTLLNGSLGADFNGATTATQFTPAGVGAPPVGAEDVLGQVSNVNASAGTFTLTSSTASYSLKVSNASTFLAFPSGVCATAGFGCLQNNQILSVDIGMQSDGSILARNLVFEDADSSDAEVEGMITGTNVGSQQFSIVIQAMSAPVSGLSLGTPVTVQYSATPATPFDIDFVHADNLQMSTTGFLFAAPSDLTVGQQVSIRRNSTLAPSLIKADRVRLRSTRVTATVSGAAPNILLTNLPSLFSAHAVSLITAQTSLTPPTIYFEIGQTINASNVGIGEQVSVRGPLFNASGARTIVTSKVVVKQ